MNECDNCLPDIPSNSSFDIIPYFGYEKRDIKRNTRKLELANKGLEQLVKLKSLYYQSEKERQEYELSAIERKSTHFMRLELDKDTVSRSKIDTARKNEELNSMIANNQFESECQSHFLDTLKNGDIDPHINAFISSPVSEDTKVNLVKAYYDHKLNSARQRADFIDKNASLGDKYREDMMNANHSQKMRLKKLNDGQEFYSKILHAKIEELQKIENMNISEEEKESLRNQVEEYFNNLQYGDDY